MDDLATALFRLAEAFPDDPGPAADPFTVRDPFDLFVWYSRWTFHESDQFDDRMLKWTPRILRLLTGGQLRYEASVPARFLEANWREWPPHRRTAVEDVLLAWWKATLTKHPSTFPVAEVLVIVTQMTGDVRPWLTTWSTVGGVAAAHQLRELLNTGVSWSYQIFDFDKDSAEDTIRHWLLADGVRILSALPEGPDLDTALTELARLEGRTWL